MSRFSPFFPRLRSGLALLLLATGSFQAKGDLVGKDSLIVGPVGDFWYFNEQVGTELFYSLGYRGQSTVIANVEAGHVWSGHEVFDRTGLNAFLESQLGFTVSPGITHYVSSATANTSAPEPWQVDFHATAVGHVLAGTGYNGDGALTYHGMGMAPFAELWSGSIATEFDHVNIGQFSTSYESFLKPYKTFFNGDLGRKADVINSSYGYEDSAATEPETMAIDGLARQNSTVAMVFAAGNEGPGANTVGAGGTAYNVITVGALGGEGYRSPSSFTSEGPSDFYNPETNETITGVRATVHIAAPGEGFFLAYYGGTGGSAIGDYPGETDRYLVEAAGTSFAAPVVAGGIALLKDVAYNPLNGLGDEAFDSRVIRSVLMAGAVATVGWNNGQTTQDGVIRTSQALDYKTGSGALDLTRAAMVYALGTSDVEGLGGGSVDFMGWDFGSVSLGGHNDYLFNQSFDTFDQPIELTISLNWFVNRSFDNDTDIASEGSFANLNLEIWSVTEGVFTNLVAISESLYNNSEFLRFTLDAGEEYGFRVTFDGVVYDIQNDLLSEQYSVAWMAIPEPSTWALLAPVVMIGFVVRRRRVVRS